MNFIEAFEALNSGKFVTTTALKKDGVYLCLMPAMPFIWQVKTIPAGQAQAGAWPVSVENIKETDYELIDRDSFVEEVTKANEVDV